MRGGRRRLGYAMLLAVGLHLDLLLLFGWLLHGAAGRMRTVAGEETIGVETIDPETARQLLAEMDQRQEPAEKSDEEKKEEKEREAIQAPGQVVQLPTPAVPMERPRDAKYVAENDSKVEKETKKEGRFDERQAAPQMLAMRAPVGQEPREPSSGSAGSPTARRSERPQPPSPEAPPAPTPAVPDPDGIHPLQPGLPRSAQEESEMAGSGARRPPGGMPLMPSTMQLAQAIGGGTQDHLPDVDDGANTSLNAKGWKFASFFNRIKRQVAQHWRPAEQYEKRDPTGNIYGSGQWVTMLHVQLKPDGTLSGVSVAKPSGLEFLDDEAIEAIKRASPYPNPPTQLVGDNGTIAFKFGFFFDVDGGPRMKVYRYSGL
jgi:TonB family protein